MVQNDAEMRLVNWKSKHINLVGFNLCFCSQSCMDFIWIFVSGVMNWRPKKEHRVKMETARVLLVCDLSLKRRALHVPVMFYTLI